MKVFIDEKEVEVSNGDTILQACKKNEKEVPHFCYHEKLTVAGNCRMCLVEVEGSPKPVASCSMPVRDGMKIHTKSDFVKKAQKGVLELLLINHPLDCPVCDQGGECDLQDLTISYGPSSTRFDLNKRTVPNKNMGPLISTEMNRCIHCTRCVRFATEIAGVPEMGSLGRGENTEITSYVESAVKSELSGNMVDICPVGALNNKPYAYKARSWELNHTDSIDVMDAVGSHIRIDSRDNEVLRIVPRKNDDINEEWISDKTRHHVDGLKMQRLDRPYIRNSDGFLSECTFQEAFEKISEKMMSVKPKEIGAIAGDLADCESMFLLKSIMDEIGVKNMDSRPDGSMLPAGYRNSYIFNTPIKDIEKADAILIVGSNIREEATMINARIRKTWLKKNIPIALVGNSNDKDSFDRYAVSDEAEVIGKKHSIDIEKIYSNTIKNESNKNIYDNIEESFSGQSKNNSGLNNDQSNNLSEIFIENIKNKPDLTYDYEYLGDNIEVIKEILDGIHSFSKKLKEAKNPIIILGESIFKRRDGIYVSRILQDICNKYNTSTIKENSSFKWDGFNVLTSAASRVGAMDIGFLPGQGGMDSHDMIKGLEDGKLKVLYALNRDEKSFSKKHKDSFLIYQGHHGDVGAENADVILPGLAYTEKNATYVNVEGRAQQTNASVKAPGQAKDDWKLIRALSSYLGNHLSMYDSIEDVRKGLEKTHQCFENIGIVTTISCDRVDNFEYETFSKKKVYFENKPYYMSNIICENSKVMADCSREKLGLNKELSND